MLKAYTVTYYLDPDQEAALQKFAEDDGKLPEYEFDMIMTAGSRWDIDKKLKDWEVITEITNRNKLKNALGNRDSCV